MWNRKKFIWATVAASVLVAAPRGTHAAVTAGVLINEIYGGGGNTGAPFTNDFVELFNNSIATVDISSYVLQYASATGTYTTFATVPASTSLAAGAYYTITAASGGAVGVAVPNVNLAGSTGTNFSATAGKIQLLQTATATTPLDQIGYGPTASVFEGTAPAPAPSNTTSDQRRLNGIDTDQNSVDFGAAAPTPGAVNVVPEPAGLALLLGFGALASLRRRSQPTIRSIR